MHYQHLLKNKNMKLLNKIIVIILSSLSFLACEKAQTDITDKTPAYSGTVITNEGKKDEFTQKNIKVQISKSDDDNYLEIKMLRIKFAKAMPVTIDMLLQDIKLTKDGESYTFSEDKIIPFTLGAYHERHTVYDLEGRLTENKLSFTFTSHDSPASYDGVMTF